MWWKLDGHIVYKLKQKEGIAVEHMYLEEGLMVQAEVEQNVKEWLAARDADESD